MKLRDPYGTPRECDGSTGTDRVPVVTDPTRPPAELTVSRCPRHDPAGQVAEPVTRLTRRCVTGTLYSDFVLRLAGLGSQPMDSMMTTRTTIQALLRRYVFQGREEGLERGRTEAKAGDILTILDIRGIPVTDEARARVTGCTDLDQLDVWVRRAVTANAVDELFDEA